ncbi:MAG: glutathione peroxidase [Planctomycetes bacterium]|nr:glutathione peroxidase [Planctomycetota bacterium]
MLLARLLPLVFLCASCSGFFSSNVPKSDEAAKSSVYDLSVDDLDGQPESLGLYRGKVLLIVNVASQCGFTPQYEGLQKLDVEFAPKGFHVLGFPCNDFGSQEPGTAPQIRKFCTTEYSVTFPLFAKVKVKQGEGQSPLYKLLSGATGELPGWNFGKYVVGKDGKPRAFFPSTTKPEDPELRAAIEKALEEKS